MGSEFLALVCSVDLRDRELGAGGDVACDLVEVRCRSRGGGSAGWVCPADDAPGVGDLVRVRVEVVS